MFRRRVVNDPAVILVNSEILVNWKYGTHPHASHIRIRGALGKDVHLCD